MKTKCVLAANILLPSENVEMEKWAVVACDQFTSQPEYWKKNAEFVGNAPSTLNMIFPEAFLVEGESVSEENIGSMNSTMDKYLTDGTLCDMGECAIFVERKLAHLTRRGLVVAFDLENYSFVPSDKKLIRATEGTVVERIPPRVAIRRNAKLELPHILILYEDRDDSVISYLCGVQSKLEKLYDFELFGNGGHICGRKVADKALADVFGMLLDYENSTTMPYLVGDGNHSLASAKACWDEKKVKLTEKEREDHPSRFVLCELVNIFDEGIVFEPIHRIVFGGDCSKLLSDIIDSLPNGTENQLRFSFNGKEYSAQTSLSTPECYKTVQGILDIAVKSDGLSVDYIHGDDTVASLCANDVAKLGIFMPALEKNDLFDYVEEFGVLSRKTFSMGEANEKRYYLEAKRI